MANKVYVATETALTFQDSGGTAVITLNNLAANVGRVSAQVDRGAGSRASRFLLEAKFEKGVAGVVGQIITVCLFGGDGTNTDGNVGVVDAALTATQALAAFFTLQVVVTTTATNTPIRQTCEVSLPLRRVSVGVVNSLTGLLRATANACVVTLTPMPDEVQ